ncbi:MAG: hypothetical protein M3Z66_23495 [Chloroflexota bacterium]|nr:hypothetical protein [Chloroflexota bacterium]
MTDHADFGHTTTGRLSRKALLKLGAAAALAPMLSGLPRPVEAEGPAVPSLELDEMSIVQL